jgi:SAM-dependent methyltransferase
MSDQQINSLFPWDNKKTQDEMDRINKTFYERFNTPRLPLAFYEYTDQEFAAVMLNQDIGSWRHEVLPKRPEIWVAGCGTNQAIFTALKFPGSKVLGTDLSPQSLETCENSAKQLGIANLELEEKSITNTGYLNRFDYIIGTGVIHHNADPRVCLDKLSAALKPGGILELMVDNYYHMLITASYQKAIRMLCSRGSGNDMGLVLSTTKKIIGNFPVQNFMAADLAKLKNVQDDAVLADRLLRPMLHSYTIETFFELITRSNLECLLHCVNQFDKGTGSLNWNIQFNDPGTSAYYEALPDAERWQISNLLMMEQSPMLWFYLQGKDSPHPRKTEKDVCEEFLDTKFAPHSTALKVYRLNEEGKYQLNPDSSTIPAPALPTDSLSNEIFKLVNPAVSMREIFRELKIEPSFFNVNRVRINLATTAFPYLKAVGPGHSVSKTLRSNAFKEDHDEFNF